MKHHSGFEKCIHRGVSLTVSAATVSIDASDGSISSRTHFDSQGCITSSHLAICAQLKSCQINPMYFTRMDECDIDKTHLSQISRRDCPFIIHPVMGRYLLSVPVTTFPKREKKQNNSIIVTRKKPKKVNKYFKILIL